MSSDYVEYKSREDKDSAPKVTDPDDKYASLEQLVRGLLELEGGGSATGSVKKVDIIAQSVQSLVTSLVAKDGPSGPFGEIYRTNNALNSAEQYRPAYEDPANGVSVTQKDLVTSGDYAPDVYRTSGSLENSVQLKSSEGVVVELAGRVDASITNGNYFVQLYGNASGSTEPIWTRKLSHTNGVDTYFDLEFDNYPAHCPNTIEIAVSTDEDSFAAPSSPVAKFRARYK